MALKLDEDTELTVTVKTMVGIVVFIIMSAFFIAHIEERLDQLEMARYQQIQDLNEKVLVMQFQIDDVYDRVYQLTEER